MQRGKLITLEGPEGSGKSTLAGRLAERLGGCGVRTLRTREPGGTALGEEIRHILQFNKAGEPPCQRAELLLFAASRAQLVEQVIRPHLEQGLWVLCDRFIDSTTAYQGYGRGLPKEEIDPLNRIACGGLRPDRTLLLDLDVQSGFDRLQKRADEASTPDRFEQESLRFHQRVREGYLMLAEKEPDRFRVLDGAACPDSVADQAWDAIADLVEGWGDERPV